MRWKGVCRNRHAALTRRKNSMTRQKNKNIAPLVVLLLGFAGRSAPNSANR